MEPISAALAKQGVDAAAKTAAGFLSCIIRPAAEEVGLLMADQVRSVRFRKQVDLLNRAQEHLRKAGISPGKVSLKTVVPLLEGATLEEDADLQEKWAALLANASAGDAVSPRFVALLSALTPDDARVLEFLSTSPLRRERHAAAWTERERVETACSLPGADAVDAICDGLISLGLVEVVPAFVQINEIRGDVTPSDERSVKLTELGWRFVEACEPPTPRSNLASSEHGSAPAG